MTKLNKWFYLNSTSDSYRIYTRDSWTIPEEGSEIWCTGWKRAQTIKPYGDGCHVIVGFTVYHCDQLMDILKRWETEGEKWGIDGVSAQREQQINGQWIPVKLD